jgi:hypothetical protein
MEPRSPRSHAFRIRKYRRRSEKGFDCKGMATRSRNTPRCFSKLQFAEKLHAYTLPRGERVNTRTKDLVDMVLLVRGKRLDKAKTAAAIRVTFAKRETHAVPQELDPPPATWEPVFDALAKECGLVIKIQEGFAAVREFADARNIAGRKARKKNGGSGLPTHTGYRKEIKRSCTCGVCSVVNYDVFLKCFVSQNQ